MVLRVRVRGLVVVLLSGLIPISPASATSAGETGGDPDDSSARLDRATAIERVERTRHRFRSGAEETFDRDYPAQVWIERADDVARQVNCLASRFGRHLDDAALQRELDRIRRSTRQPQRLGELLGSLDHDPVAIKEGVVRPLLAGRWLREETAWDPTIQRRPRAAARDLALRLDVQRSWDDPDIDLMRIEYLAADHPASPRFDRERGVYRVELSRADLAALLDVTELGRAVITENERWIRVDRAESSDPETITITRGRVPKVAWDVWWSAHREAYDTVLGPRYAASDRDPPPAREARITAGPAPRSVDPFTGSWDLSETPVVGRDRHAAVWTGLEMIVFGGTLDEDGRTPFRYDPVTDSWSAGSSINTPLPRLDPTAVWTGSEMLVWGGDTGSPSISPGGRYDPVLDSWSRMSLIGAPVDGLGHTMVWTGSEVLVWGGSPMSSAAYDPSTNTWRSMSTAGAPSDRSRHTAVWTGTRMLVWGGTRPDLQLAAGGGSYDPGSDSWTAMGTGGEPATRTAHAASWTGTEMLVWGGFNASGCVNTGARYRPSSDAWLPMSPVGAPSLREEFSAIWTGDDLVVWGGFEHGSAGASPLDTGGRYDPASNSWSATAPDDAPIARYGHSAVWSGAEMIVWGGRNGGLLATGARYDPSSNEWTEMVSSGEPTSRIHHTATWTGAEMVVFGGEHDLESLDDGGIYDPVLDSWEPTPTANTPYPRSHHNGVWTGAELIVWGGVRYTQYGDLFTNTGRRFDPVVREWSVMQNTSAPSPRAEAVAIWVAPYGMFVWGGRDASSYPVTGGLYFPNLNDWLGTGVPSSSSGRAGATAVWTGREALAWGGLRGSTVRDDGIRYDPIISSWATIYPSATAGDRWGHSAVWTGLEMVVFGGGFSDSYGYEEPAAYNPTPGSWRQLSAPATLQYRRDHSSVWTGDEMVVWGGYHNGYLDTGLRWSAASNTWIELTTIGAPAGRAHHTAVWAGDRMIVWGGTAATGVAIWSPIAEPAITGPLSVCTGETALLEAPEGYDSYLWSPGGQTTRQISATPSESTRYRVDVTAGSLAASAVHGVVVGVDMDGNGGVNGVDLELLIDSVMGGQDALCPDVDGDGIHDARDLSAWIDLASRGW